MTAAGFVSTATSRFTAPSATLPASMQSVISAVGQLTISGNCRPRSLSTQNQDESGPRTHRRKAWRLAVGRSSLLHEKANIWGKYASGANVDPAAAPLQPQRS